MARHEHLPTIWIVGFDAGMKDGARAMAQNVRSQDLEK
jgi:hypothetical protein